MTSIFLTGFPGFLGSALVARLLDRTPVTTMINCLVQQKFLAQANARIDAIEGRDSHRRGRIIPFVGDITQPDLGLGAKRTVLQEDAVQVFHLAAIYDLGVNRELSMRVNVEGTRHIVDFARGCARLERLQYISTCYVSGRYEGLFRENDLAVGQTFNNLYEETKYLAEVEVQTARRQGLPVTVYRPAIVVGDSKTGETQKYDGPYYLMQLIARQRGVAFVPTVGDPMKHWMNIVPRDFVVDAIDYLSAQEASANQVYQLASPHPPTINELIGMMERVIGRKAFRIPVPKRPAKQLIKRVPPAKWLTKIEAESLEYLTQPTRYSCENTLRDLEGSGITCPPLEEYVAVLYDFWRANRQFSSKAMV